MDKRVLVGEVPVEILAVGVVVPHAVEPYRPDWPVVGEQLGELVVHEFIVGRPVKFVGVAAGVDACPSLRIGGVAPVEVGVVEVEDDALAGTFVGKLFEDVPAERCGVDDVVVRLGGVPHRKTVVVARCDGDVFRSRPFDGRYPFFGVEVGGVECPCGFGIFSGLGPIVEIPFALSEHAVDAPVDENAETVVGEPLACFKVFRRGGVGALCGAVERRCHQQGPGNSFQWFHVGLMFVVMLVNACGCVCKCLWLC